MKLIDMTCPHCGAHLKVNTELQQAYCEHCGALLMIDNEVQQVQFNAEQAGYNFEKGRQRAQAEATRYNNATRYTTSPQNTVSKPKKKRRTWLWVLGWVFIFPIPLTILLLRRKQMKPVLKYGLIALAWIIYLIIGFSGKSDKDAATNTTESTNIRSLSFTKTDPVTLKIGESYSEGYLNVSTFKISEFSPDDILFVSDNPEVATIAFIKVSLSTHLYYRISAVGAGETNVYATSKDGTILSEKISITVPEPILVKTLNIVNAPNQPMAIGDTIKLSLLLFPEDAENKTILWTSSDESVVQVNKDGNVHALGGGTATITAASSNDVTASVEINVDGSKHTMSVKVQHPRQDDVNIGDEWSYIIELNGEAITNSYTLSAGDELTFYAKFTESDENPDIGEASTTYIVTEEDLVNGFVITMDLYVTENGGSNSGKSAYFIVKFTFTP